MSALPQEKYKDTYQNWRYDPFPPADMAVEKEEDDLVIPAGAPFVIQLVEVPRKNAPTTVLVRAYDTTTAVDDDSASGQKVLKVADTVGFATTNKVIVNRGGVREEECVIDTVQAGISLTMTVVLASTHTGVQADAVEQYIDYTEAAAAPAATEFRVDYPPADGEGTGLVQFNAGDATKVVRVNYWGTGSPMNSQILDTKVSYPAGDPVDNQIIAFDTGAPAWKYNPKPYFHEGPVIYNAGGESESCLLFRFKRRAEDQKVYLELKGAKLHQGYYSELLQHNHAAGTLAGDAVGTHVHAKGTLAGSQGTHTHLVSGNTGNNSVGHTHLKGTLSGSQATHTHLVSGNTGNQSASHTHLVSGNTGAKTASHTHAKGTLAGSQATHTHSVSGNTGNQSTSHYHNMNAHQHDGVVSGGSTTGTPSPSTTLTQTSSVNHAHGISFTSGSGGNQAVTIAGTTASGGASHTHTVSITSNNQSASHTHAVSITSAAGGNEAVTIAGSTAGISANHTHSVSITSAAGGNQAVTIAGNTAAGGGHGHTISGSTANEGVTAKAYSNACKVWINGVNKTADILALTGLAALGDGTSGHGFITSGSGEMDIGSLVPETQIHQIMVSEPEVGAGGRVLMHLELI